MPPRVIAYASDEAERLNTTAKDILSRSHFKTHREARQSVMRRLRADGFTYPQIGMMMGRHHTTVMHACREGE